MLKCERVAKLCFNNSDSLPPLPPVSEVRKTSTGHIPKVVKEKACDKN